MTSVVVRRCWRPNVGLQRSPEWSGHRLPTARVPPILFCPALVPMPSREEGPMAVHGSTGRTSRPGAGTKLAGSGGPSGGATAHVIRVKALHAVLLSGVVLFPCAAGVEGQGSSWDPVHCNGRPNDGRFRPARSQFLPTTRYFVPLLADLKEPGGPLDGAGAGGGGVVASGGGRAGRAAGGRAAGGGRRRGGDGRSGSRGPPGGRGSPRSPWSGGAGRAEPDSASPCLLQSSPQPVGRHVDHLARFPDEILAMPAPAPASASRAGGFEPDPRLD